ncbi:MULTISPECIES: hypothetical protein [Paenibacillus]|uniref:Uncharacterized protein n=1 Tax=Paenibacillus xylanilyticus TaxID=248903 RepID=A0A7Y6BWQ8_9BACL|nr:hypothetical protein [Paenibacillus xylanilyticus]NUU76008.1 hypothetical protein [Paenibacillus xylanilyticus]
MLQILGTWLIFILLLIILHRGIKKHSEMDGKTGFRGWRGWLTGLFVVGALPLGFASYTELTDERLDANIGLGIAMLFAWGYCALLCCVGLIVWGRYGYKRFQRK